MFFYFLIYFESQKWLCVYTVNIVVRVQLISGHTYNLRGRSIDHVKKKKESKRLAAVSTTTQ